MKKLVYILISMVVFSCTTENDLINDQNIKTLASETNLSTKSGTAPVSLVKSFSSYSFYRGFRTYTREFLVKVDNLAFDKKVSVYHETENGEWEEIRLAYKSSIGNNEELWYGIENTDSKVYSDEFVIKYEVDGNTYWDNNNGGNYKMDDVSGTMFADPNLAISVDEKNVGFFDSYQGNKRFSLVVDVKNIAPAKDVQVVYTTDGWNTVNYAPLNFLRFWSIGYIASIYSPNPYGVERWGGVVEVDSSIEEITFAVVYKVNGQEYWDNNYGKNYSTKK